MAHIHEKIDFTASVYVVFENKVLLHLHPKTNKWMPPGGHIELEEDPNQAVLREAKEECGLDVTLVGNSHVTYEESEGERELIPPRFMNRHYYADSKSHEHVDLVYFGRASTNELTSEALENGMQWLDKKAIEEDREGMLQRIRGYALTALKELAS
jgi:8-oxo-dGTP pyrophosphatase MutT (NUDIX family)